MMTRQVEEDIEEMRAEERAQQAEASISMRELLCSPTLRAPLLIGVVMQLSQQLSGINAVTSATHLYGFSTALDHRQLTVVPERLMLHLRPEQPGKER